MGAGVGAAVDGSEEAAETVMIGSERAGSGDGSLTLGGGGCEGAGAETGGRGNRASSGGVPASLEGGTIARGAGGGFVHPDFPFKAGEGWKG